MNYSEIKSQAPSPRRLTILASAALIVFTVVAGFVGSDAAFATTSDPYAVKITATRTGDSITLAGSVIDNATQKVLAAPTLIFDAGKGARSTTTADGVEIVLDVFPDLADSVRVNASIEKDGRVVQKMSFRVTPSREEETATGEAKFTGEPISLSLKNADVRDVLRTFAQLTGLDIAVADDVQGSVTVNWHNVPWDQALDSMLNDLGLTYRVEGSKIHVTKK